MYAQKRVKLRKNRSQEEMKKMGKEIFLMFVNRAYSSMDRSSSLMQIIPLWS